MKARAIGLLFWAIAATSFAAESGWEIDIGSQGLRTQPVRQVPCTDDGDETCTPVQTDGTNPLPVSATPAPGSLQDVNLEEVNGAENSGTNPIHVRPYIDVGGVQTQQTGVPGGIASENLATVSGMAMPGQPFDADNTPSTLSGVNVLGIDGAGDAQIMRVDSFGRVVATTVSSSGTSLSATFGAATPADGSATGGNNAGTFRAFEVNSDGSSWMDLRRIAGQTVPFNFVADVSALPSGPDGAVLIVGTEQSGGPSPFTLTNHGDAVSSPTGVLSLGWNGTVAKIIPVEANGAVDPTNNAVVVGGRDSTLAIHPLRTDTMGRLEIQGSYPFCSTIKPAAEQNVAAAENAFAITMPGTCTPRWCTVCNTGLTNPVGVRWDETATTGGTVIYPGDGASDNGPTCVSTKDALSGVTQVYIETDGTSGTGTSDVQVTCCCQ